MPDVSPLVRKLEHGVDLTDGDRAVLTALGGNIWDAPARADVIREGDPNEVVHLLLDGFACREKLLPDGSKQISALLLPGDICHLHSAILHYADHSIRTLTPCRIVELSREQILLLIEHPRIARALWWSSLVDEAILREWLTGMGQRDADQRMAHLFCEVLVRMQATGLADYNSFNFPVSQPELADILGLTPVHVNRTLQELRSAGLIIVGKKRVEIPDVARLKAFCSFKANYLHLQRQGRNPS